MSHEAQPLGVAAITKNGTNFNVALVPTPTIINNFQGSKIAEQPINANVVAHVQADSTGNVVVILRAGPIKLGPFYATLTTNSPTMSIDLNLKAKNPSSGVTNPIDILTGKVNLTFAFSASPKTLSIVAPSVTGLLLGGIVGGILTPIPILSF